jgi:single-stranded DNA-binding protein
MPEQKRLSHIVGNLGKPAVKKYVDSLEKDVVELSVAVTMSYGDDGETRWVQVAVWNEGLQEAVLGLAKGAKVAVEGVMKIDSYEGKPQYKMSASRIGSWKPFERLKTEATEKPAKSADDEGEGEAPLAW